MMTKIDYRTASELAKDIQATQGSIDDAIVNVADLTNSVINVCRVSEISGAKSQATMAEIASSFSRLVDAREGFVGAHRQIVKIQRDSNLEAVDFGCLVPQPKITGDKKLRVVNG